ncbi:hypothetical protein [Coprococcus comes]|uniref:hypothetical protein n=1 Tax=Coprococcus comes TaxID=410072 RepID=UPI001897825D|nr:hypothetical protein [Coprococcus comes]
MRYKVGDKVRVRSDLNVNLDCSPTVVEEMLCKAGDIVTISAVNDNDYRIDGFRYYWTDEMFEGLVEGELTAEEAIKVLADMCARECKNCELGKLVKESRYSFCSAYRREHPDKVVEILKQWKKDHEKKEIEVELAYVVRVIEDLGYTKRCVYEGDVTEVKEEAMKRVLKEYCKEHEGKFFTVYEEICRVKE